MPRSAASVCGRHCRRVASRCLGQRTGRAGCRCRREAAALCWAATGGKVFLTGALLATAIGDIAVQPLVAAGAGHGAPAGRVTDTNLIPRAKRDRHSGGQRPSGKGATGRVRALMCCAPLRRIQKEGKDLCK